MCICEESLLDSWAGLGQVAQLAAGEVVHVLEASDLPGKWLARAACFLPFSEQ